MDDYTILDEITFDSNGLVPVVTQAYDTKEVLMQAYANRAALIKTIQTGEAHYYSRSRQALWKKGETSGHTQAIKRLMYDCDGDAILYVVAQTGPACHTNAPSCFYRTIYAHETPPSQNTADTLTALQETIQHRQAHPKEGSYTNYLLDKGIDKILKKVGEETAEVIIAAKNNDPSEICYETADLLYHVSVLLTERGLTWPTVMAELNKRRQ